MATCRILMSMRCAVTPCFRTTPPPAHLYSGPVTHASGLANSHLSWANTHALLQYKERRFSLKLIREQLENDGWPRNNRAAVRRSNSSDKLLEDNKTSWTCQVIFIIFFFLEREPEVKCALALAFITKHWQASKQKSYGSKKIGQMSKYKSSNDYCRFG